MTKRTRKVRPPVQVGDVFITDPSASPAEQMESIHRLEISESPEDLLRENLENAFNVTKFPVEREDVIWFLAMFAYNEGLQEKLEKILPGWLSERDQYMEEEGI